MHDKKLYGTATVGTKGQIVIPAEARDQMGIAAGDRLYIAGSPTKQVLFILKEDSLREMIEQFTNNLENAKHLMNTIEQKD